MEVGKVGAVIGSTAKVEMFLFGKYVPEVIKATALLPVGAVAISISNMRFNNPFGSILDVLLETVPAPVLDTVGAVPN